MYQAYSPPMVEVDESIQQSMLGTRSATRRTTEYRATTAVPSTRTICNRGQMHGEVGIVPFLRLQHLRRFTISLSSRSTLSHHESCRTSGRHVSIGRAELDSGTLHTRAVRTAQ